MTAVARSIGHDLGTRQVIVRICPSPPACKVMGCAALRLVKSRSVTAKLAEHRRMVVALLYFAVYSCLQNAKSHGGYPQPYLIDVEGGPGQPTSRLEWRAST